MDEPSQFPLEDDFQRSKALDIDEEISTESIDTHIDDLPNEVQTQTFRKL